MGNLAPGCQLPPLQLDSQQIHVLPRHEHCAFIRDFPGPPPCFNPCIDCNHNSNICLLPELAWKV